MNGVVYNITGHNAIWSSNSPPSCNKETIKFCLDDFSYPPCAKRCHGISSTWKINTLMPQQNVRQYADVISQINFTGRKVSSNGQQTSVGASNGFMPSSRQASTETNEYSVHWTIYASPCVVSIYRCCLTSTGIPISEIGRSLGRRILI